LASDGPFLPEFDPSPIDVADREPASAFVWEEPPRKFQHKYGIHIALFMVTLVTTTFMGSLGGSWGQGLLYSLPILGILGAHEFGHYFACRWHNVDATLPYFIPAPPPVLTGTFGAVIRIREAFPSKKALFDIGVAGPIAGFVALLPFLWWGVAHSTVVPVSSDALGLSLGEPLLFKFVEHLTIGTVPDGYDVLIHPTGFAAWFGMLATALNLLPFGQLDGGHISYALAGRRAKWISIATLGVTMGLTFRSTSWFVTAMMMVAMAFFIGIGHPRVVDENAPLDRRRQLVALLALAMFVLCFTPVPIQSFIH
jgi:membrane-associated protease RseP (regulator of RpoE activity)